jgi:hypothetical protein
MWSATPGKAQERLHQPAGYLGSRHAAGRTSGDRDEACAKAALEKFAAELK